MSRWPRLLVLLAVLESPVAAQQPSQPPAAGPTTSLTLDDALRLAQANNPDYRQVLNNLGPAQWQVRGAYGDLSPNFSVSGNLNYTGAGNNNFGGGLIVPTSAQVGSGYSAGFQWLIDGPRVTAPGLQKANLRAVDEDIANQESLLRADITTQYLNALQADAQVGVARQQLERNQNFLDLANAKFRVGQGTLIEVRQAEVQVGQAQLDLLRAVQTQRDQRIDLFRRIGIVPPTSVDQVVLPDSFKVVAPDYQLDQLLSLAEEQNPSLKALRARSTAAGHEVRSAKSQYFPALTVRAGWSGYTQHFTEEGLLISQSTTEAQATAANCDFQNKIIQGLPAGSLPGEPNGGIIPDCNAYAGLNSTGTALHDTVLTAIHTENDKFPFHFTSQPFGASLTISLPIWDGFSRNVRVAQARAQEEDAKENVRARGLQVRADVESRLYTLRAAYEAIGVQTKSRESARDQLRLAQDRYRLGSGTSLEVSDAQNAVQRAEGDYVNAVYAYHKSLTALEAAVGRPLR
jgi:outer membrane protein